MQKQLYKFLLNLENIFCEDIYCEIEEDMAIRLGYLEQRRSRLILPFLQKKKKNVANNFKEVAN